MTESHFIADIPPERQGAHPPGDLERHGGGEALAPLDISSKKRFV